MSWSNTGPIRQSPPIDLGSLHKEQLSELSVSGLVSPGRIPLVVVNYQAVVSSGSSALVLGERRGAAWPKGLCSVDTDTLRIAPSGRKLLLEAPAGHPAIIAQYFAVEDGPLDLNDPRFEVLTQPVGADPLPAYLIQFTHPAMSSRQPWAFRLWPTNDVARTISGPVEFTERAFIQYLHIIQRPSFESVLGPRTISATGAPGASISEDGIWFEPWAELAHLDDEWPDSNEWPAVIDLRPKAFNVAAEPHSVGAARRFVELQGRSLEVATPASVSSIIRDRPTIGAIRRQETVPAPLGLTRTREVADRFDRLQYRLRVEYRDMWAREAASDDNRDMWRPWNNDGTRRWGA